MVAQVRGGTVKVEVVREVKAKVADQQVVPVVFVAKEDRAAPVVEAPVVAHKMAEAKVVPDVVRVADKVVPAVEANAAPVDRADLRKVPIPHACWNMPSSLMRTKTASSVRTNCKSSSATS